MNSPQLIKHIQDYCLEHANEKNVAKYSRYFKEGSYDAYGLSTSQMDSKTKELLSMPGLSIQLVLDAAPGLFKSGKYEEIGLVLLLVRGLHKQYSRDVFNQIETLYSIGINNWAHADILGMQILPAFVNKNIIVINDFISWLSAGNKFQRRSVPVTLIKSLKTHDNFPRLFSFIECLMTDPAREVHQGTGWFLREAWKRKPEETETFLLKWKDVSPRLIFQYATEKMSSGEKMRFRKGPKIK